MSTGLLAPYDQRQYLAVTAGPVAGGYLYTYAAGTTTLLSTYTTAALNVAHANPIVLTAGGFSDPIYFDQSVAYKFVLTDAEGIIIETIDPTQFIPPLSTTENWVLTAVSSDPSGGSAVYNLLAQSPQTTLFVSYWDCGVTAAYSLGAITSYYFLPTGYEAPLLFVQNTSTTHVLGLLEEYIAGGTGKLYLTTGQNTDLQIGQLGVFIQDTESGIGKPIGWHVSTVYCPAPPTHQTILTDGTVYTTTDVADGIGANIQTGQLQITVTQTDAGDPGGTVTVKSDTSNPPTTQRAKWNYGSGVAQQTFVINILAGERFTVTLTGASANRTVTGSWLGGALV